MHLDFGMIARRVDSVVRHGQIYLLGLMMLAVIPRPNQLLAQSTLGSSALGGTVRDQSGAVVSAATVVLEDVNRGVDFTTSSDSSGLFRFPNIVPSHYMLRVTKPSFDTSEVKNILVELGDSKTIDVVLPVGQVTSTVSVEADKASVLDIGSNSIGSVINAETIGNLPLNGQDFLQLALVTSGVNVDFGQANTTGQIGHANRAVIVAGNGPSGSAYSIDGIATRGSRLSESAFNISTADIDQFKVQESFFLPDQGPDPGIVNVITKGGTNLIHGEVYEFLKNDYFDAVNYFATLPTRLKRNQFGAAVGGPIKKDKLFFFANYEGTRQISTATTNVTAPTAAEFGGNFTLLETTAGVQIPIYDPATYNATTHLRSQFSCNGVLNVICANRINGVSQNLLAYYVPGAAGVLSGTNLQFNPKSTFNDDQFGGRVDWAITPKQFAFVQYIHQNDPQLTAGTFPGTGTSYPNANQLFVVQHTWTLQPTLINTFRLGVARLEALDSNQFRNQGNLAAALGVPNTVDGRGVPAVSLSGFTAFGHAPGDLGNIDNNYQLDDGMSYVHGKHSYGFGASVRYFRDTQSNDNATANSTLTFNAQFTAQVKNTNGVLSPASGTGSSFADFLLGDPAQVSTSGLPPIQYRYTQFLPYVTDNWKISPRVTLNYGISWFFNTTPNPQGIYQGWVHDFNYATSLVTYAALGQISTEVAPTPLNHFTPRFGVSWNPERLPNTVIRVGVGTYFEDENMILGQYTAYAPPFSTGSTLVNAPAIPQPTYVLGTNIFPQIVYPPLTSGSAAALAAAGGSTVYIYNPNMRTPYSNQWDLSVQQALTRNDNVELTYLGNSAHKQLNTYDPSACTPTLPGGDSRTQAPNSVGLQCIPSTNPYPQYASLLTAAGNGNANYNGLLAKFRHITSKGLTLDADYTYAKGLTDSSARSGLQGNQIATCRRCDYGPVAYDVKHRFVLSYVYELPFGRGKPLGNHVNTAVNLLAGGWVLTGIATFETGNPLYLTSANGTGVVSTVVRPNQLCSGKASLLNQDLRSNGFKYFNTTCFPSPASGYFGNSSFDPLYGPGNQNWDMGAQKQFPLPWHESHLQIRVEAFNIWNHPQWGQPGLVSSTAATYGVVTSSSGPRVLQGVAKVTF